MAQRDTRTPAETFRDVLQSHIEKHKREVIKEVTEKIMAELVELASGMAINLEEYYSHTGEGLNVTISLKMPNVQLPVKEKEEQQKSIEK